MEVKITHCLWSEVQSSFMVSSSRECRLCVPRNRSPRVMKHYCPTGKRNHVRTLKRLLDT